MQELKPNMKFTVVALLTLIPAVLCLDIDRSDCIDVWVLAEYAGHAGIHYFFAYCCVYNRITIIFFLHVLLGYTHTHTHDTLTVEHWTLVLTATSPPPPLPHKSSGWSIALQNAANYFNAADIRLFHRGASHGNEASCPLGYVAVGVCGSGRNEDCQGSSVIVTCCAVTRESNG